jgi:hypothetical protein
MRRDRNNAPTSEETAYRRNAVSTRRRGITPDARPGRSDIEKNISAAQASAAAPARHCSAIKRVGSEKEKDVGHFLQEAPKGEGGNAQRQSNKRSDQVFRSYSADGEHGRREQDEREIGVIDLRNAVYPEHR